MISRLFSLPLFRSLFVGFVFALSLVNCSKPQCFYDTDCPDDQVCKSNACGPNAAATACKADSECADGQRCLKGLCVRLPTHYEFPEPPELVAEQAREEIKKPEDGGLESPEEATTETKVEQNSDNLPPDGCRKESDCFSSPDTHCTVDLTNPRGPTLCRPRNGQGSGLGIGVACDSTQKFPGLCLSMLCRPDKLVCTQICEKNQDCLSGLCERVNFDGLDLLVCSIGKDHCRRNNDCPTNQVCALAVNNNVGFTKCTVIGSNGAGQACLKDGDCKSGVCITDNNESYCGRLCAIDSDCLTGYECKLRKHGGLADSYRMCVLSAAGEPCKTNADCKRQGTVCSPRSVQGKIVLSCQTPRANAKADGDPCTLSDECRQGICLPETRRCSSLCSIQTPCLLPLLSRCGTIPLNLDGTSAAFDICIPKACDTTKTSADCAQGQICSGTIGDNGAYGHLCVEAIAGGAKTGQACTKARDCENRMCLASRCTTLCKTKTDCPNAGYSCSAVNLEERPNRPSFDTSVCTVPPGGLPCTLSSDCPDTEACLIVDNGASVSARCRPPSQGSALGELCTKDADCASGYCLKEDGICSAPCKAESDCDPSVGTPILRCRSVALTPSGGGTPTTLSICSFARCKGQTECKTAESCSRRTGSTTPFLGCSLPASGKKAFGEACTADLDCQSGLCHSTQKTCSSPCEGGSSLLCPLQSMCEATATGPTGLHLCIPIPNACLKDSDCTTQGQRCILKLDANQRPTRICGPPVGALTIGTLCRANAECDTGLCHPLTKVCSRFCDPKNQDADCPNTTAHYRCTPETLGSQGQTATMCRLLLCRSEASCVTGETCFLEINAATFDVLQICRTATPGTTAIGQACTPKLPNSCVNQLCDPQGNTCLGACLASRDCAATQVCKEIALTPQIRVRGCAIGSRTDCGSDVDCSQGQACEASINPQGNVITTCQPLAGRKAAGVACVSNADCGSNLCDTVTKKCLKICKPGQGDCDRATEFCGESLLFGKPVTTCLPRPSPCLKQSDCLAGTVCGIEIPAQGQTETLCLRPAQGSKATGAACDPSKGFPGECQTRLCHPTLLVCVPTCEQDTDCQNGNLCGKLVLTGGILASACVPSNAACETPQTCPDSQPVCALDLDPQMQIIRKCIPRNAQKKPVGDSCIPGPNLDLQNDCQNNFCEAGRRLCTATCERDSQCSQSLVCGQTTIAGKSVKGCIPPASSLCQKPTDCPLPSLCQAVSSGTTLEARCGAASGSLSAGEECDASKAFPGDCATQICPTSSKRCSLVCSQNADCALGQCRLVTLAGSLSIQACDASCAHDGECPQGQICAIRSRSTGDLEGSCVLLDAAKKDFGQACDPALGTASDCRSNLCNTLTSTCSSPCSQDADCPASNLCSVAFVQTGAGQYRTLRACVPSTGSCSLPSECQNANLCAIRDVGGTGRSHCQAPDLQASPVGDPCDPGKAFPGDCQTRLCDPQSLLCTALCKTDNDCLTQGSRSLCKPLQILGTSFLACQKPLPEPTPEETSPEPTPEEAAPEPQPEEVSPEDGGPTDPPPVP